MCAALLVAKTPVEEHLVGMLTPTIEGMGYQCVRLRLMGSGGRDAPLTLQIMAEKPDGTMEVDDCAALSTALSAVLDVEDPIDREYGLEISSPGIDRPLTRSQDFAEYSGHRAKVELTMGLDGRRNFRGDLGGLEGDSVTLILDDLGPVSLPLHDISDAKLVITDALIAESLKKKRIPDASQADDVEYETEAPQSVSQVIPVDAGAGSAPRIAPGKGTED